MKFEQVGQRKTLRLYFPFAMYNKEGQLVEER